MTQTITESAFYKARALASRSETLDKLASGQRADWSLLTRLVEADIAVEIRAKIEIIAENTTKIVGTQGISEEEAADVLAAKLTEELAEGLHDSCSTDPMSNAIDAIRRRVYRQFIRDYS